MKNILKISFFLFLFSSCATVYLAPNAITIAEKHETVAIIKPKVSILSAKADAETVKNHQIAAATDFQQEIYSYMLRRKTENAMTVNIQDVDETNAILAKNPQAIELLTTQELCDLLGVDAIMTSNFGLTKPMSDGAAIAMTILFGYGATNEVSVSMSIKNCDDKSLLWKYDHTYTGGIGSTPAMLVKNLMGDASRKMPYYSASQKSSSVL